MIVLGGMNLGLSESISELLEPVLNKLGVNLFNCSFKKEGKDYFLRIFVEKMDESQLDLDTIVMISEHISPILDESELIKVNYMLDVSSVGAERPIKVEEISKYVGKYINVHIINPIDGQNTFEGDLLESNDSSIIINIRIKTRKVDVEILKSNIDRARLAIKF